MKTKTIIQNILAVAAIFLTASTAGSHSMGTGVGNATDGPRNNDNTQAAHGLDYEQTSKTYEGSMGPTGYTVDYEVYDDLTPLHRWGNNSINTLQTALHSARIQIEIGSYGRAKALLVDALKAAAKHFPKPTVDHGSPLTKKLVDRGILYSRSIENVFKKDGWTQREIHTEIYFLYGYVEMIIEAWKEIDQNYYIDYYHSHRRRCSPYYYCRDFNYREFHRKYIDYVIKEISFVLSNFTEETYLGYVGYVVVPVGDIRAVLLISEIMSFETSKDILGTLWAHDYSYIAYRLQELHKNLAKFNKEGYRFVYPDGKAALNSPIGIHSVFQSAVSSLSHEKNVYKNNKGYHKVLAKDITLTSNNRRHTVHLSHPMHINCIVVTGEAYGSDGRVKVMVKGQIKGDLYLPRRDPEYVVNINSRTRAIRLIMESGKKVRISSVKLREDCSR